VKVWRGENVERASFTDGRGKTTSFAYDKRRLLTSLTDANGKTATFTYDTNGHPATSIVRNNQTRPPSSTISAICNPRPVRIPGLLPSFTTRAGCFRK
jgi:YD repeat-containing protein